MSVSSGLQPLFDFNHALVYRESGTVIPVLEPCDGGELFEGESSGLNCSDICLDNEILFKSGLPVNLVNCGLFATYFYENATISPESYTEIEEQLERIGFLHLGETCDDTFIDEVV